MILSRDPSRTPNAVAGHTPFVGYPALAAIVSLLIAGCVHDLRALRADGGSLDGGDARPQTDSRLDGRETDPMSDGGDTGLDAVEDVGKDGPGDVIGDYGTPAFALRDVRKIATGMFHTCAIVSGTRVFCWGDNRSNQSSTGLGIECADGADTSRCIVHPTEVVATPPFGSIVDISAGDFHTCVLLATGDVQCWGANGSGQLGDATTVSRGVPMPLGLTTANRVSAGGAHTCITLTTGEVMCFGMNSYGQLGTAPSAPLLSPTAAAFASGAEVFLGKTHTCAVLAGAVECAGENTFNRAGDSGADTCPGPAAEMVPCVRAPAAVAGVSGARQLATGAQHSCALQGDGSVVCWGSNAALQLGRETTADTCPDPFPPAVAQPCSLPMAAVDGLTGVLDLALGSGAHHVCARMPDGTVRCWGDNAAGQLGDTAAPMRAAPTQVAGLEGVQQVAVGRAFSCAVLRDESVRCWGRNRFGQLGIGDMAFGDQPTPVPVIP